MRSTHGNPWCHKSDSVLLIDVNIHPTKMDVKFSKLEELTDLVYNMIRNRISKNSTRQCNY